MVTADCLTMGPVKGLVNFGLFKNKNTWLRSEKIVLYDKHDIVVFVRMNK